MHDVASRVKPVLRPRPSRTGHAVASFPGAKRVRGTPDHLYSGIDLNRGLVAHGCSVHQTCRIGSVVP
jgi:hypothetical protein